MRTIFAYCMLRMAAELKTKKQELEAQYKKLLGFQMNSIASEVPPTRTLS